MDALDQLFEKIDRLIPLEPDTYDLRCAVREVAIEYGRAVRTETAEYVQAIWKGAAR